MAVGLSTKPYVKCSLPNCNNRVGEHKKGKPKQFCEPHRKQRKKEIDEFKLSRGCENHDGRYGNGPCNCIIQDPSQLEINHINGYNSDRREANIEVLCANSHRLATKEGNHHLTPRINVPKINDVLFTFE